MTESSLASLGWRPEFAGQLRLDEVQSLLPARVVGLHRSRIVALGPGIPAALSPERGVDMAGTIAIGDWLLVNPDTGRIVRILERSGLFQRRAAGTDRRSQLIAANVDTLFVVTSADRDFNAARLERYLAVAREGGASPVIVISKSDCNDAAPALAAIASKLAPGLIAEMVDARSAAAAQILGPWCDAGQTVALVGSSGVGKSTLVNTLTGGAQSTQAVRAHDQRGRHSTTARSMHQIAGGAWIIDTPGMRSLGLVDVEGAIDDVFAEISVLAQRCKFIDCEHGSEPGCAVAAAIAAGEVAEERLARYRKLVAESRRNDASLADRRAREKSIGKLHKRIQHAKASRNRPD